MKQIPKVKLIGLLAAIMPEASTTSYLYLQHITI